MAKFAERLKARKLRALGLSLKSIAKKLSVSPASASSWCSDILLTPKQILELEKHSHDPLYGKRLKNSLKQHNLALARSEKLKNIGIKETGTLTKRELFLTGVALYWAEGFKKDSQAGLASLDPDMIKFYLKWLNHCFGYETSDLSVRVTANISHKHRIDEIQNYWASLTNIPQDKFQKPFFQKFIWKKTYENPNAYYGILRVKVKKSTDFLRKINGFIEGLKLNARLKKEV